MPRYSVGPRAHRLAAETACFTRPSRLAGENRLLHSPKLSHRPNLWRRRTRPRRLPSPARSGHGLAPLPRKAVMPYTRISCAPSFVAPVVAPSLPLAFLDRGSALHDPSLAGDEVAEEATWSGCRR